MPITFDREVCCDFNETISREWLITNGLGGYAAGTVAGTLTRMQHGLLVAPPRAGAVPQLLLAKIDEEVVFDQRSYYLGTNEYRDGTLNPAGFVHLESFRLEEGFPLFTYRLGGIEGIMLEKRIWMAYGQNTTFIQYRVLRTSNQYGQVYTGASWHSGRSAESRASLSGYGRLSSYIEAAQRSQGELVLTLLPFAACRPYDQPQYGNNDWHFQVQTHAAEQGREQDEQGASLALPKGVAGCTIRAWDNAMPYHVLAVGHPQSQVQFLPTGVWYWHVLRRQDQAAGLAATDDLYLPGVIRARLWPGEDAILTIIVTAEELTSQTLNHTQLAASYQRAVESQRHFLQPQRYFGEGGEAVRTLPVLPLTTFSSSSPAEGEFLQLLRLAGDRFVAQRALPRNNFPGGISSLFNETEYTSVLIPGYYRMEDCTRDTLIALPGLILHNQRYNEARQILHNLARHFKHGLLPNRLPRAEHPLELADYASVDTTLWYFYALDHYMAVTRDYELLDDLYQRLADSINWHIEGTYNGIRVDPADGLLRAHQPGKALTWMNAVSAEGEPITPRYGKPVEVNALWFHALSLMDRWSQVLYARGYINHTPTYYAEQQARCQHSFNERFWYEAGGYLYDVVDGPTGNDSSLRPNQLLALSLRHPVLQPEHRTAVLDLVSKQLVTPYGLRTLAPQDSAYHGQLPEDKEEQQRAIHQGAAWPWFVGPFIEALLHVKERKATTGSSKENENLCHEYVWRKGLQLLEPFRDQLHHSMLGMIGHAYAGDAPYTTGSQVASAISMGEILRAYRLLARLGVHHPDNVLPV